MLMEFMGGGWQGGKERQRWGIEGDREKLRDRDREKERHTERQGWRERQRGKGRETDRNI